MAWDPTARKRVMQPGKPERRDTIELTLQGTSLESVTSASQRKPRTRKKAYPDEDAARTEYTRQIRSALARGFRLVPAPERGPGPSLLLIDELLAQGSPRLLEEVLRVGVGAGPKLGSLGVRWYADRRPAVRAALLSYVDQACGRAGHKLLVKCLLALAEREDDHELMAHFMLAFDRLEKRWLIDARRYGGPAQKALVSSPLLPGHAGREDDGEFSTRTRHHLCRRVLRYFRRMAQERPARFVRSVAPALARYEDADLAKPSHLLDAWSLCHILYWGSPVLRRAPRGIQIAPNAALADLKVAPMVPQAWVDELEQTLELAATARSRPVARFAVQLLVEHHEGAIEQLDFAVMLRLLRAPSEEPRVFAAERLHKLRGLDKLPLSDWLALMDGASLEVLPEIVRLVRLHVDPKRLSLEECIDLARSPAADSAELGLHWAQLRFERAAPSTLERQRLLRLAGARAPSVRTQAAAWLATLLRGADEARPEEVRELCDAADAAVRERGLSLVSEVERFRHSPLVWAAMAESPHADVRDKVVLELEARHKAARLLADKQLAQLWATTLLDIRRAKLKPRALGVMGASLFAHPERADDLLPLLRIALRSLRPPERRPALAALMRAAHAHPSVRSAIRKHLPELELGAIDREVSA